MLRKAVPGILWNFGISQLIVGEQVIRLVKLPYFMIVIRKVICNCHVTKYPYLTSKIATVSYALLPSSYTFPYRLYACNRLIL